MDIIDFYDKIKLNIFSYIPIVFVFLKETCTKYFKEYTVNKRQIMKHLQGQGQGQGNT